VIWILGVFLGTTGGGLRVNVDCWIGGSSFLNSSCRFIFG
jgi:hypothetical protein